MASIPQVQAIARHKHLNRFPGCTGKMQKPIDLGNGVLTVWCSVRGHGDTPVYRKDIEANLKYVEWMGHSQKQVCYG